MANWTTFGFSSKQRWPDPPTATRRTPVRRVVSGTPMAPVPPLSARLFRASASYRLVEPGALQAPLPTWLRAHATHPAFGGLLVPAADDFRVQRVVTRDTARLFQRLARPGRAPRSVPSRALRALVLDGVLEIHAGRRYLSGAAARSCCLPVGKETEPRSATGMLSLAAMQDAGALQLASPTVLARLLYHFNTLPASPAWRSRYPDSLSLERELRRCVPRSAGLDAAVTAGKGAWLSWERAGCSSAPGAVWKLYVSPVPDQLVPALGAASRQRDAFAMKVGRDVANILRPDKLVLYFNTPRQLARAARQLERDLAGVPAHGVPFTGQTGASALLSWGVDPGGQGAAAPWSGDDSWRAWLTQRLATAMVQALKDPGCAVPSWCYAMERVSLDGVDVRTWAPSGRASGLSRALHGAH